jgi:hypothetical protein
VFYLLVYCKRTVEGSAISLIYSSTWAEFLHVGLPKKRARVHSQRTHWTDDATSSDTRNLLEHLGYSFCADIVKPHGISKMRALYQNRVTFHAESKAPAHAVYSLPLPTYDLRLRHCPLLHRPLSFST